MQPTATPPKDEEDLGHYTHHEQIRDILRRRYLDQNKCYTALGSNLIALRPFSSPYPSSHDIDQESQTYVDLYKDTQSHRDDDETHRPQAQAHLYSFLNSVYFHLRRTGTHQSVLFSGERNSGKTRQWQQSVSHVLALSTHNRQTRTHQQVQHSATLVHLFSTTRDGASRAGLRLELQFTERGRLSGARYHAPYYLERRWARQGQFKAFSALTAEERARFQVPEAEKVDQHEEEQKQQEDNKKGDEEDRSKLRAALKALGFSKSSQQEISRILLAILTLDRLCFVDDNAHDSAQIKNPDVLTTAAHLLGVDPLALETALTCKSKLIKRDITTVFLNAANAQQQCHALADTLYGHLFDWILDHINGKLHARKKVAATLTLVDIPGFSLHPSGNIDTLATHFLNESLYSLLLDDHSNIDTFTHHAKGLFSVLHARASRTSPTTDEQADIEAMQDFATANPRLSIHHLHFILQHYWGQVQYDANGLSEADQDYLPCDFYSLLHGSAYNPPSTNAVCAALFSHMDGRVISSQKGIRPTPIYGTVGSQPMTVTQQLIKAVEELSAYLKQTNVWCVLCLRPNKLDIPNALDDKALDYIDLAALAKRNAYNTNFDLDTFLDRYEPFLEVPDHLMTDTARCEWIIQDQGWAEHMAVIREHKIHLSSAAFQQIEQELRCLEKLESRRMQDDQTSCAYSESEYSDTREPDTSSQLTVSAKSAYGLYDEPHKDVMAELDEDDSDPQTMSTTRRRWIALVWTLTWWVPSPLLSYFGGMKRRDVRVAWREKLALCILIFFMCTAMILFIIGFGPLVCPRQDVFSMSELQSYSDKKAAHVAIRGEVFDLTKFVPHHWATEVIPEKTLFDYGGKDATNLFPVQVSALCDGTTGSVSPEVTLDFQYNLSDKNAAYHDFRYNTNDYRPDWYFEKMVYMRKNYRLGFMGYDPNDIKDQATHVVSVGEIRTHRQWAILHGEVYDLTYYSLGGRAPRTPEGQPITATSADLNFMDNTIVELFRQLAGMDISKHFDALPLDPALRQRQLVCLRNLFFVGKVDTRRSPQCLFSEYFLLIITGMLCTVIVFKFIAALQLGSRREPEDHDKFIVCQVPCYTESEESLRKTIDSIAVLNYDDKRKLLFLVCDGMIIGSGNDRPTPRIVLDILGVDSNVDPEPLSFLSLGPGNKQHNMGKIYSGLYECSGHVVPYMVVVKVGHPGEAQKPGNRGKRDSQMVLMRFLNKVHFDSPMSPMELEIYHQMKNVIGVNPSFYEFVLMIDADTEVIPDSLNRMVSCFVHDAKIVGLCGETKLANERESWVTMIQVYEYYISHFLAKAFESLFGSVTCLPGCFCMYRLRSPQKSQPLLVSNQVIDDYAENNVHTLHQKNLLHLGEDRYLTTLILKHFPNYKTKFTADACCLTNAPESWSVLLSQRRRWINSTVHNLGELSFLTQLCGFCCFSMRFVVILDLMSTLTMPAVVCYLGYLIYRLISDASQVPMISILLLCGVYGLQAFLFFLRRKWEHIGWMVIYILAIPLFSFFVPIYSFWHFDDFSWGNTRVVLDQGGGKKAIVANDGDFDPKSIPLKRWSEYENEMWETGTMETKRSSMAPSQHLQKPQTPSLLLALSKGHKPPSMMRYTMAPSASFLSQPDSFKNSNIQPSDEDIRREVHRITLASNLMTVTKKQVREQLSRQFGADMSHRKDYINHCIEGALRLGSKNY